MNGVISYSPQRHRTLGLAAGLGALFLLVAGPTPAAAQDPGSTSIQIVEIGLPGGNIGRRIQVQAVLLGTRGEEIPGCAMAYFVPGGTEPDPELAVQDRRFLEDIRIAQGSDPVPFSFDVAADRIRINNTGDHPTDVFVGVWDTPCASLADDPPSPIVSTTRSFCVARDFGGDWYPECAGGIARPRTATSQRETAQDTRPQQSQRLARLEAELAEIRATLGRLVRQESRTARLEAELAETRAILARLTARAAPGEPDARPGGDRVQPPPGTPPWHMASAWDRVAPGMSEQQVIALLGEPTRKEDGVGTTSLYYRGEVEGSGVVSGNVKLNRAEDRVAQVNRPVFLRRR